MYINLIIYIIESISAETGEKSYLTRREELEQLLIADKEKQLLAVSEVVNERKGRVDVEVDAYRTSEM